MSSTEPGTAEGNRSSDLPDPDGHPDGGAQYGHEQPDRDALGETGPDRDDPGAADLRPSVRA